MTGVCRGAAIALRLCRGGRLRLRGGAWLCAAVRAAQAHTPSDTSSFTVRGDGVTMVVASAADTTAASVSATSAGFTKTVVAVSTTKAAANNFFLFTVRAVAGGFCGVVRLRCAVRAWQLSECRSLAGWLGGQLAGCLAGRLAACVSGCLAGSLVCLVICLAGLLSCAGWLACCLAARRLRRALVAVTLAVCCVVAACFGRARRRAWRSLAFGATG